MELLYVIYSHTDFLDMLKISSDYMETVENKILLINKNNLNDNNLNEIYSKFKSVIFYEEGLAYSDKLSIVLKIIKSKYILFTHEVDILLQKDDVILNKFIHLMDKENIDRIDLQPNGGNSGKFIKILKDKDISEWPVIDMSEINDDDMCLGHHTEPNSYMFNVNPSIWKLSSFLEILEKFKNKSYREIEYDDVQNYCTKFKIYNLYSRNHNLRCGYMNSLPLYKYLHITHYHRLLRFDGSFKCEFGWTYIDAAKEYIEMVNKYNLKSGKRPFS